MHSVNGRRWIAAGAVLLLLLGALYALSNRLNENAALPAVEQERKEIRFEERGLEFLVPGEQVA